MYRRETQENGVTPPDGPRHHLKYHLQLKTKHMLDAGKPLGKYVRQSTVNKGMVVMKI